MCCSIKQRHFTALKIPSAPPVPPPILAKHWSFFLFTVLVVEISRYIAFPEEHPSPCGTHFSLQVGIFIVPILQTCIRKAAQLFTHQSLGGTTLHTLLLNTADQRSLSDASRTDTQAAPRAWVQGLAGHCSVLGSRPQGYSSDSISATHQSLFCVTVSRANAEEAG
jgi:hypothetical protein